MEMGGGFMETYATLLLTAVVAIIGVVIWYIWTMNLFARLAVKVNESDSGIDVALTKRFDTLTKMLDVTKAYARHEVEVLANTVTLRRGMTMGERTEANRQMDRLAGRINALAEAYPDLKASEVFVGLQRAVVEVEEHLQAARRIYNMNVSSFNQLLVSWPAGIVGRWRGHTRSAYP
jgi:LemA protein